MPDDGSQRVGGFLQTPDSEHIRGLKSIPHDCILVLASSDASAGRVWAAPQATTTSEPFRRHRGATLGWLLDERPPQEEIRTEWARLLGHG